MSLPYMPTYIGDYLRDTGHLTTVQHGAYWLLICHYWCVGSVPGEADDQMAAITRLSVADWHAMKPVIMRLFKRDWTHKRVEEELGKAYKKSDVRRAAGREGGLRSGAVRSGRRRREALASGLQHRTSKIPPHANDDWSEAIASDELKQLLREKESGGAKAKKVNGLRQAEGADENEANGSKSHEANGSIRPKQLLATRTNKNNQTLESVSLGPVDNSPDGEGGPTDEGAFRGMGIDPVLPSPLRSKADKDIDYQHWLKKLLGGPVQ